MALLICLGLGACAFVEVPARGNQTQAEQKSPSTARVFGLPVARPERRPPSREAQNSPVVSDRVSVGISVLEPPTTTTATAITVAPGDTVYAIARRTGVSPETLIVANNLEAPYTLAVGQVLRIPKPTRHIVRRGETLFSIARQYKVDVYALASANGLTRPYQVGIGQILSIPQLDVAGLAASDPPQAVAASSKPARPPELPKPPPAKKSGFIWPVRGAILSGFGPKTTGLHNDGINIAAKRGTVIKAAQSGVVAYAGNQLQGFGNMLLIKHESGWITAYAHAESLLVKRGDRVGRGQTIAKVGSTGGVNEAQLHFELRKGKTAVDPMKHLPPLDT